MRRSHVSAIPNAETDEPGQEVVRSIASYEPDATASQTLLSNLTPVPVFPFHNKSERRCVLKKRGY